jgi:large subunit ribosomal protein L13
MGVVSREASQPRLSQSLRVPPWFAIGRKAACQTAREPIDYVFRHFRYQAELVKMKTYMARPGELEAKWWVVDASGKVVGRLASEIAMILMGKHRPTYTPHVDTGDYVVVVNADKVVFTGKKWEEKRYTWYTGWTGLRTETAGHRIARKPERVLKEAVRRMLPKNKLAVSMLAKLKVYAGSQHPHQGQQPEPIELAVKKSRKRAAKASPTDTKAG